MTPVLVKNDIEQFRSILTCHVTAFSAVIATVNNIGPGLGEVGPSGNYGGLNPFQLGVLSFAMLLGRLELLSVLVLFSTHFWRK